MTWSTAVPCLGKGHFSQASASGSGCASGKACLAAASCAAQNNSVLLIERLRQSMTVVVMIYCDIIKPCMCSCGCLACSPSLLLRRAISSSKALSTFAGLQLFFQSACKQL